MIILVRATFFISISLFVVMTFNFLRMGGYIKPETPRGGGRNLFPMWPKNTDFIDAVGQKYRNRYILLLALFLVTLVILALEVSTLPEGSSF